MPTMKKFSTLQPWLINSPFTRQSWLLTNVKPATQILTIPQYAAVKSVACLAGGVVGLLIVTFTTSQLLSVWQGLGLLAGTFIGWLLPDLYLKDRAVEAELAITRQIPEFLLLLSIILETSGHQSIVKALDETAQAIGGKLGEIVHQICARQNFSTNQEVLHKLVEVCPQQLLKELAQQVDLANTYGGSITNIVHQLADQAIQDEVMSAKEQGDKLSGLLLGPLLIFHLPALLILYLIPSVLAFTRSL